MGFLRGLFGFLAIGCGIVAGFGSAFFVVIPALMGEPVEYLTNAVLWTGAAVAAWVIYKALPESDQSNTSSAAGQATQSVSAGRASSPPGFGAFATDMLKQSLLDPGSPVSPRHLVATDGMLHPYYEADIDWRGIWDAASDQAVGVPPFGLRPYWISSQEPGGQPLPLSTLAFRGSQARAQVAIDPETPESVLQILASDPDPLVRRAADSAR